MTNFKKYSSIETFDFDELESLSEQYADIEFVIQEKLDGANITIIFDRDGGVEIGSRTESLGEIDKLKRFYRIEEALRENDIKEFIAFWSEKAKRDGKLYSFYGELFGKGVSRRIDYGDKQLILLFDLRIDGEYATLRHFYDLLEETGFHKLAVPTLRVATGLKAALNEDCEFISCLSHLAGADRRDTNYAEGIVIKPMNCVLYHEKHRVAYKKKNPNFKEKGAKKPKLAWDATLSEQRAAFVEYVNENRMLSVFSKHQPIEAIAEIGKYIQLIVADALEEFEKDVGKLEINKKLIISRAQAKAAALLKDFLARG
ncbi:MAG: hypothetical protein LBQ52_04925 [Helicobacteraceae bacterium]|nr:hypothetical protein [Helicobacteraceae bacterium]